MKPSALRASVISSQVCVLLMLTGFCFSHCHSVSRLNTLTRVKDHTYFYSYLELCCKPRDSASASLFSFSLTNVCPEVLQYIPLGLDYESIQNLIFFQNAFIHICCCFHINYKPSDVSSSYYKIFLLIVISNF